MVTRREKMKHTICKLQEQIFHLQMKLIEKDLYPGQYHRACPHRLSPLKLSYVPQLPSPGKPELPPPLIGFFRTIHILTLRVNISL